MALICVLLVSGGFAWSGAAASIRLYSSPLTVSMPLVLHGPSPETAGRFSWSASIAVAPDGELVWVVNPDSGSVTLIDGRKLTKLLELPVGREPWALAIAPDGGSVYVVDRASGALVVVDANTRRVRATLTVGPEPGTVVLDASGTTAYVSVSAADQLVVVDTASLQITDRIRVGPRPYALAIGPVDHKNRIYVTHLLALARDGGEAARDDGREGRITVIDAATHVILDEIVLPADQHGFPNLLTGITMSGTRAWVPHVRAAPDLPNGLTTTVFAAIAMLDLHSSREDISARLLLNDEATFGSPVNNPLAAIPAPNGKTLYVVLAGSDLIEVIDIADPAQPRLRRFLPAGNNPRGMALSPDGRLGYVMSYLSRSIIVLDLERLALIAQVPVTTETLDPAVLRGKLLFNTVADPRMARVSWTSCASCHMDGDADGVTWMFPDGPRQTPALWNAGQTLPWHWSAALDEPQDLEMTIQLIQHGLGLAPGSDPPLLGTPNAGRSADLDALAAFISRGIRTPALPMLEDPGGLGRRLFVAADCAVCHGGPLWTSSALPGPPGTLDLDNNGMIDSVLHDVSTQNPRDIRGASGFDVPSLLNVGLTAPYLHDGSMLTLDALLATGHPTPHGQRQGLSEKDLAALVAFIRTIGADTPPVISP